MDVQTTSNYSEMLKLLFQNHVHAKKLGLANILRLSEVFGFPHCQYPTIHVAGTNGKGSVTTKIARALHHSGLRVGVYTSPHLFSFRERVVIGNELISEEETLDILKTLFKEGGRLDLQPTFFEWTTMLAFYFFHQKKVDVAVIETGLGGRLDATNVITPLLSVITSIGEDHKDVLGIDLESIAQEKAGIIKPNVPIVIGPHADLVSIREKAREYRSPLYKSSMTLGFYDKENAAVASVALELLRQYFPLSAQAMEKGLSERPLCRFEEKGGVIFDVAHNPQAMKRLVEALNEFYPQRKMHFVFGMSADKSTKECLRELTKQAEKIYLVEACHPRAARIERLSRELRELEFFSFSAGSDTPSLIRKAHEEAQINQALLVICGSFYIMPEAKIALGEPATLDPL